MENANINKFVTDTETTPTPAIITVVTIVECTSDLTGQTNCTLCNSQNSEFIFMDFEGCRFVKCTECGLVYQNPRTNMTYEKNYWGKITDPDGRERNLAEERNDKINNWYGDDIKFVNNLPPGKILDIGCGFGFFLLAINDSWEKYGVEISEYASEYVKSNQPDINLFTGNLMDAGYDDNSFDVIYLYHVIEHLENPQEIMVEIHRILKSEGTLIVGTPNIDSFCAKRFGGNFRLLGRSHINLFSKKTLTKLLRKTGFDPGKVIYPFLRTKYFTLKNLLRLINTSKISPPFYGSIMTTYAKKCQLLQ